MALLSSPWLKQPWQAGYKNTTSKKPTPKKTTTAKKTQARLSVLNEPWQQSPVRKPTTTRTPPPVRKPTTTSTPQPRTPTPIGYNRPTGLLSNQNNNQFGLLSQRPSANQPRTQPTRSVQSQPARARTQPTRSVPNEPWRQMTSQAAPAAAARYTHPREPWRTWNSKAEADAHYAKFDAVKAEQDARLAAQSQATKDRLAKEARDKADANAKTYWDPNHGWVTNVGNLLVNGAGAIVGGLGGAALGALAGPAGIVAGGAAGAAAGWNLGDLASDALYSGLSGDPFYTSADQIDAGTIGAGLAGGLVSLGGVLMTPQQAAAQMAAGGAGGAGAAEGAGGSPGLGALADQVLAGNYGGGAGGGGAGNVLSDTWDFFTQNPLGQAAAGAGTTYLADQLFNEGQGTSAIMDFFTGGDSGSGSGSGGGNGIAYGTDLTPQYIIDAQKEALERARTLTNSYADYEGPLTAGAAQNELLAANVAADAVGGTADALNDARDMTTGADARYERREGPSSYGSRDDFFDQASLSGYMNPYLEFVQQDTLDNISRENEAIQAALGDQMIQVGAFGGSRTGVAEAENNRNMRQQMLQYINQSNAEAFENARDQFNRDEDRRFAYSEADRNQFNTDLGRRLNVGQALGSLASMDSALTQQEINNLMSTGGVLRGIEQAGYTNDFNAYQDFWNRMLGLNAAENAVALGLQSNVLEPPAPEEDPDRLGQILGVLAAGAGLWDTIAGKPSEDDRRN